MGKRAPAGRPALEERASGSLGRCCGPPPSFHPGGRFSRARGQQVRATKQGQTWVDSTMMSSLLPAVPGHVTARSAAGYLKVSRRGLLLHNPSHTTPDHCSDTTQTHRPSYYVGIPSLQ